MSAPTGAGVWISWNGAKTKDASNADLVAQAVKSGLGWLAVKSGNDGRSTRWLGRGADLIARAHDAGIQVFTWNYSTPDTWPTQVEHVAQVLAQGVDGHIIDAEQEFEYAPGAAGFSQVDRRPAARAFMAALRARVGADAWIAHAPLWRPQSHRGFPYAEFGAACDAVLPQAYWTAAGQPASAFCAHLDACWAELLAQLPAHTRVVMPIGITYGRGDGWDAWTTAPSAIPIDPTSLNFFLDRYPVSSLFSWDAANACVWPTLERRAETRRLALAQIGPCAADPDIDVAHDAMPDTLPEPPTDS